MLVLTGVCAVGFALIHLGIGKLALLDRLPRSRWLSFAGGVAVAYVFLHVMPELSGHRENFAQELVLGDRVAEVWIYGVALAGLALFYGLERAVKLARKSHPDDRVEAGMLWLHLAAFGVYNVLIGYLLVRRDESGLASLLAYAAAMALHFVATDFGLRQDQKEAYDAIGRWLIAGAVLGGWALGLVASLPQIAVGLLFAFVAGGVVLNVLKEELPDERESRFWPFALGAAGFAALLFFA